MGLGQEDSPGTPEESYGVNGVIGRGGLGQEDTPGISEESCGVNGDLQGG